MVPSWQERTCESVGVKTEEIEKQLRKAAERLLREKKVDLFIGYGPSTVPGRTSPVFITDPKDAEKLIWNEFCSINLANYLPRYFGGDLNNRKSSLPNVGLAAKGCDGRAAVVLINENQVPRQNLYIVGISCEGMAELINGKPEKLENCRECSYPAPPVYDELIGDKKISPGKTPRFKRIEEFRKKPVEKRWEYFQREMSKCIRCYACRQVCPTCYCRECFTEETRPRWQGVSSEVSEVIYYHLGRLFHQAGRCVDCGSCSRACPVGIDLRLFLQGLAKDVKDLYDYEAGLALDQSPPLAVFKPDDLQGFITEP